MTGYSRLDFLHLAGKAAVASAAISQPVLPLLAVVDSAWNLCGNCVSRPWNPRGWPEGYTPPWESL